MSQDAAQRKSVHAVFNGSCGKSMPQIVETGMGQVQGRHSFRNRKLAGHVRGGGETPIQAEAGAQHESIHADQKITRLRVLFYEMSPNVQVERVGS